MAVASTRREACIPTSYPMVGGRTRPKPGKYRRRRNRRMPHGARTARTAHSSAYNSNPDESSPTLKLQGFGPRGPYVVWGSVAIGRWRRHRDLLEGRFGPMCGIASAMSCYRQESGELKRQFSKRRVGPSRSATARPSIGMTAVLQLWQPHAMPVDQLS